MADVIHVTTLVYIPSVNTPDFPEPTWKHNPDMSQVGTGVGRGFVATVPLRYWKWDGVLERPIEMTQGEKDAVDAAALNAERTAGSTTAHDRAGNSNIDVWQGFREVIEALTKLHNKMALRVREIEGGLDDVKNTSGGSDNIRGAIPDPSQDVIDLGPPGSRGPATFSRMQNRTKANEIADFRQDLLDGNGHV